MQLFTLVIVALRLAALNFFLHAITVILPSLLPFLTTKGRQPLPWIVLGGVLLLAGAFWFLARPIAGWVTRGSDTEVSVGTLTLTDCYSLVFVGVALVTLIRYFPATLNWLHYLLTYSGTHPGKRLSEEFSFYDAAESIIPFIIGVFLFTHARTMAIRMHRYHGHDPA